MKECINYKIKDDGIARCETCNHFCEIKEGRTGICGIRQNIKGKFYLLAYGKVAAAHIDPIEKKPLYHFLPGSLCYSFATIGCNFRCANCQNHNISQMFEKKRMVEEYAEMDWGYDLPPVRIVENALKSGCKSIAYTYTEPTVFLEYCLDTMKLAKEKGLKNIWVSNGFMSDKTLDVIIPYLDAINVDIKSFDDEFYRKVCGARIAPVLENCKRLIKEKIWLEITTLVIPNYSDDEKMLKQIARFIKNELGDSVPWHVSAFFGARSWKLKNVLDTPPDLVEKVCDIGKEEGLKYVYQGNI